MSTSRLSLDHFWHGCDYNPEQWLERPEILAEDLRLMPEARMNVMSLGIFSWSMLEPEEGRFQFDWLDRTIDDLHRRGIEVILATPSGARPPWLSARYPEVLRLRKDGLREVHGARHNHCPSSPLYREKTRIINQQLAGRYGAHPAVRLWHISNEFGGCCYCNLCADGFRAWLQRRYGSLDRLNAAWNTRFWSSVYTDWMQIEPPLRDSHWGLHGLRIDWRRFASDLCIDFYRHEVAAIRDISPQAVCTTNFHPGGSIDYDMWAFAKAVDVVAWDNYPYWGQHREGEHIPAIAAAFDFDLMRSCAGGQPWLLMESTPSHVNWHATNTQKKPGLALLSSLQAVAHGAQSVQYFQWRKSYANFEKQHGAVIDHAGAGTRVFREVAATGAALERLRPILASTVPPQVGLLFDWNNGYTVTESMGLRNAQFKDKPGAYREAVIEHYRALVANGYQVDLVDPEGEADLSRYPLLVAAVCPVVSAPAAARLAAYVAAGGVLAASPWFAQVDLNDNSHLGGFPGPACLREALGIWAEEWHSVPDWDAAAIERLPGAPATLPASAQGGTVFESLHLRGAEALARFSGNIYASQPAMTRHCHGRGQGWYLASGLPSAELAAWYRAAGDAAGLVPLLSEAPPPAVTVSRRRGDWGEALFVMNFGATPATVRLDPRYCRDALSGAAVAGSATIPALGLLIART